MHRALRPGATTIAHVTDAHVAPRGRRTAVLKDRSVEILEDIVAQIAESGAEATVFGGDNIDNRGDGPADLEAFLGVVEPLDRWRCLPGNHEAQPVLHGSGRICKHTFQAALGERGLDPGDHGFSERVGDLRVIGIDTTVVGAGHGHVADEVLRYLSRELRHAEEPHVVVVGHHLLARPWAPHHVEAWDEEYLVHNRETLVSLLAAHPRVRAYLCGHHHASRIDHVGAHSPGGGFYHVVTPSPVAFPHGARLLSFDDEAMHVTSLRPRIPGVLEAGREAVMTGRKASRFAAIGGADEFVAYVAGRPEDNDVVLPHVGGAVTARSELVETRRGRDSELELRE